MESRPAPQDGWSRLELDLIVDDYFSMLQAELAGHPYSKTEHRLRLRERISRSAGAIERKHQNISAVLRELALPWIRGYKPLRNFQRAILDAVHPHLATSARAIDASVLSDATDSQIAFVPAPRRSRAQRLDPTFGLLIRLFDPAARDADARARTHPGRAASRSTARDPGSAPGPRRDAAP